MMMLIALMLATDVSAAPMHRDLYTQNIFWTRQPEIIICTSQTAFSREDVERVLDLWNLSDAKITEKESCFYHPVSGKIKITDSKKIKSETAHGITDAYHDDKDDGLEYFSSAVIQLDASCNNIDILAHEMGHALGYRHFNEKKDVMNSRLPCRK